jgi:hypothetical protein
MFIDDLAIGPLSATRWRLVNAEAAIMAVFILEVAAPNCP